MKFGSISKSSDNSDRKYVEISRNVISINPYEILISDYQEELTSMLYKLCDGKYTK